MQTTPALVLFDLDGTLIVPCGIGGRAMRVAAVEVFGDRLSFEGQSFAGRLDPQVYAQAAAASGLDDAPAHHARFHAAYHRALLAALRAVDDELHTLPGVPGILALLRDHGATTALVSGNYRQAGEMKLRAAGLDRWFKLSVFGDDAADRDRMVDAAIRRAQRGTGNAPRDRTSGGGGSSGGVVVVGDTVHDIAAARANGVRSLGVATGGTEQSELVDAGADAVVTDLTDPGPLLALLR